MVTWVFGQVPIENTGYKQILAQDLQTKEKDSVILAGCCSFCASGGRIKRFQLSPGLQRNRYLQLEEHQKRRRHRA